jgi:hypothetical protein
MIVQAIGKSFTAWGGSAGRLKGAAPSVVHG